MCTMLNPVHILNQMGVITSFSVAKKIAEDDVTKFFAKEKKAGKSVKEINTLLREKVLDEIEDAITSGKIPGLVAPEEVAKEMGVQDQVVKNIPELNRVIMVIVHKMAEKQYDKMSLCYFINSLVNMLNLSEEDFEKFHQENGEEGEGDDDDEFSDEV